VQAERRKTTGSPGTDLGEGVHHGKSVTTGFWAGNHWNTLKVVGRAKYRIGFSKVEARSTQPTVLRDPRTAGAAIQAYEAYSSALFERDVGLRL
jgi:hypothetical protein